MASANAKILIEFDGKGAIKGLRQVKGGVKETGKAAKTAGGNFSGMAKALAGIAAGVVSFRGVSAAMEKFAFQQRNLALMDNAMRSMGRSSAGLRGEMIKLAQQIQREGIIGDEASFEATKILTTFGKISDDVMPRVLQVAADFAAFTGGDMAQAATLLGKASEGMASELKRYGISISEATQKSKDFNAILDEIEVQVGGANAAVGKLASSASTQLGNAFGDMSEDLGEAFSEETEGAIRAMTAALQENAEGLQAVFRAAAKLAGGVMDAAFGNANDIIGNSVLEKMRSSKGGSLADESAERLNHAATVLTRDIRNLEGSGEAFAAQKIEQYRKELKLVIEAFRAADDAGRAAAARASADNSGAARAGQAKKAAAAAAKQRKEDEAAAAKREAAHYRWIISLNVARARAAEKEEARLTEIQNSEAQKRIAAAAREFDERERLREEAARREFESGNLQREFDRRRGALQHGEEVAGGVYNYEMAVAQAEEHVRTGAYTEAQGAEAKEIALMEYQAFLDEMRVSTDEATETMVEAWGRFNNFDFTSQSAALTDMGRSFIQAGAAAFAGGKSISAALRQVAAASAQRVAAAAAEFAAVAGLDLIAQAFGVPPGRILNSYYGTKAFSQGGGNSGATANTPDGYAGGSASVYHAGGVVGAGGAPTRRVAAGVFADAPRLHGGGFIGGGLRADERPAILQTGEGVLSRRDMRALRAGKGGDVKVEIINNTGAQAQASASEREDEAGGRVISIILTSIEEGAVGQRLEGQYGLRRQSQ